MLTRGSFRLSPKISGHRAARPGDDRRHQLSHHDLRFTSEYTERGTKCKAHAQSADEHARTLDRFNLLRRERCKRRFGARKTAVHQFVATKHDGELGAASHQPQLPISVGNACGIDFYPWDHAGLLARWSLHCFRLRPLSCGGHVIALSMTRHALSFSRHEKPELCIDVPLIETEGAGKTGCQPHPQPRVRGR